MLNICKNQVILRINDIFSDKKTLCVEKNTVCRKKRLCVEKLRLQALLLKQDQ